MSITRISRRGVEVDALSWMDRCECVLQLLGTTKGKLGDVRGFDESWRVESMRVTKLNRYYLSFDTLTRDVLDIASLSDPHYI